MNISIIIPCYNEEEVLPLTLKSLKALALDLVSREDCSEIEFVMVDDGSQDRTFELLTEASKADKRVKVIRFSRNFGHQAALLAGYEFAKGDVIVSLDSDLQDPPELIKTMLDKIKEGYDVVFAARQSRKNDSWFKRKTAEFFEGPFTKWITTEKVRYALISTLTIIFVPLFICAFYVGPATMVEMVLL